MEKIRSSVNFFFIFLLKMKNMRAERSASGNATVVLPVRHFLYFAFSVHLADSFLFLLQR